jgi:hypothetical protein
MRGGEDTLLGPLERGLAPSMGSSRVRVFLPHLRVETDPVSETLCFIVSRIQDDGQSPKVQ